MRKTLLFLLVTALPSTALAQEISLAEALSNVDELEDIRAVAAAQARALASEATAVDRLPGPSAGAEFGQVTNIETEIAVAVGQEIPLNGARGFEAEALRHEATAAKARGELVVQGYKAEVAEAFFEARYRQERLLVLADRITAVERSKAVLARREAAGDASRFEVERVAREVRRLQSVRATEEASLAAATGRLAALLQLESAVPTGPLAPDSCGGTAPESPQVAAMEADVQAAKTRGDGADSAWMPTLELEAAGVLLAESGGPFEPGYSVGLGLSFPFWSGSGPLRDAAEARAIAREAALRIEADQMKRQADTLAKQCSALLANSETIATAIPETQKLLQRAEAGYGAGELSLLELLDAQQAVLDERLDLLDAQWGARRAQNQWLTRVGGWP